MKLLFVSNLFPDATEPIRGLDNATLLHALRSEGDVEIRVIALRPTLSCRRIAPESVGLVPRPVDEVFQPNYLPVRYLPKFGGRWNDRLASADLASAFRQLTETFRPEAVLVSWLYPDACAVTALAEAAGLPVVQIAQGTDVHGYLSYPVRRRKILAAVARSRATICRSGDLARRLREAGADEGKLRVIYNGVEEGVFHLRDPETTREALGLGAEEPVLLFVGNLLPVKDPLFLVRATAELNRRRLAAGRKAAKLTLIGDGPLRRRVAREIRRLGEEANLLLAGRQPPETVARWMAAADLLCLSSRNEGFPNVILEAMACALPVVSTAVGGIAEKVGGEARGRLVEPGDLIGYVEALEESLAAGGGETRKPIAGLGWARAAARYAEVLESAAGAGGKSRSRKP